MQLETVRDANQFDSVQAIWIVAWHTSHLHTCNNDSGMEVLSECLPHPHHVSVQGAVRVQCGLQEYQGGGGGGDGIDMHGKCCKCTARMLRNTFAHPPAPEGYAHS